MKHIFSLNDIIPFLVEKGFRKPLIIPFPYDLYGGQREKEHILRLDNTILLYHMLDRRKEYFDLCQIECSGGLANINGLTTATDMVVYLKSKNIKGEDIFIGEEEHTHTGQQVYLSAERHQQYLAQGKYDVIIPVSNPYHLRRILLHYHYYGLDTYGAAIPYDPGLGWKFKEAMMYASTCTIDHSGHLFDFAIEKRRTYAAHMYP